MLDDRVRAVLKRSRRRTPPNASRVSLGSFAPGRSRGRRGSSSSTWLPPGGLRGAGDRRIARLLDGLARRRPPLLRRAGSLARGRSGEGRGLARQHRRGRARRDGRADRRRRVRDPREDRRRLRHRSSSTPKRTTTSGSSSSPGPGRARRPLCRRQRPVHEETLGAYSRARQSDPRRSNRSPSRSAAETELSVVLRRADTPR